jgi:Polyketide cyclase / dehydrase and lipid transport
LIILSPLLYGSVFAGAFLGRIWFRKDRLNLLLLPGLIIVVLAEVALRGPHHSVVVDEMRIEAPPSRIWPHVLAFERIPAPPDYWLFRVGLPYPTETTNGGNQVGADRTCRFSGDAVFRETIVEFEPLRLLTFDIVESPPDPELIGHLDAHRGQFELRDNGDGTTTLIGRTWYSLHVRPAFYFDWWTHEIFGEVHLRVMRNVKRLAEAGP